MRLKAFALIRGEEPAGFSPHVADDFAAGPALLSGAGRDEPGRGGKDSRPHTAQNPWQPVLACVDTAPGLRDPLQVRDHALAVPAELQLDDEVVERLTLLDVVAGDVTLLLEQAGDSLLHPRRWHRRRLVHRAVGITDAGQHVGDRV